MTERERFLAALRFRRPDRVPFNPGHGRRSTLAAWHTQGLPAHITNYHAYMREQIGLAPAPAIDWIDPGADFRMIPQFEEKVIERRPPLGSDDARGTLIVQDWKGNICEISDEFDVSYLRNAVDFVTRSWIRCPVESRADWQAMKQRYNPDDARRLPPSSPQRSAQLRGRTWVSALSISGPFWQLREWLGFEGLCMLFMDDPGWVAEMIAFWQDFVSRLLRRTFADYVPDVLVINEDMAYKEKPMIGPDLARRMLLPCWRAWAEIAESAGVGIYEIDSDGHVGELIPLWIDAGFVSNTPQEVAAGNDLPAYRQRYGTRMAYQGGIDRRAIAAGGQTLRREIDRLRPVIDAGGYIPSCDHGIPHDVSWPNFLEYSRLLAQATGWL